MPLKTLVKLSQVTNLSDARYAAGMGVQMMGFNINPDSEFYVDAETFSEITGWISGVDLVGEFDGEVFSYSPGYEFDYFEISNPEFIGIVKDMQQKIIFHIDLSKISEDKAEGIMLELRDDIDFFLLTSADEDFFPPKLKTWAKTFPILVRFGISGKNIRSLLEEYEVKGISILGDEEKVVGFKDYDHLTAILEELDEELD